MRLASREGIGFWERQSFRWFRARKRVWQLVRYGPQASPRVLFVVGCQRSGTTVVHHIFRLDWRTVTFDEVSPLSTLDLVEGLRLNPLPDVARVIARARAPLVVAKPLVESQNLVELMAFFPGAKALWMYRHYADVAASNVEMFGPDNGHTDLRPILAGDELDWRSVGLPAAIRRRIRELYSPTASPHDAAALFWFARNSLFFAGNLGAAANIALCRYDDLVQRPAAVMTAAYEFIGFSFPGPRIVKDVFGGSLGKGKDARLSAPIRTACEELMRRLDKLPRLGVDCGR